MISFFYKTILISYFCISQYYLVFQEISSVASVFGNAVKKYETFHNLQKYLTIIILFWEAMFISFTMSRWFYAKNSLIYLHMLLLRFDVESCGVVWCKYPYLKYRRPIRSGRNSILVESLLWESNNFRVSVMSL